MRPLLPLALCGILVAGCSGSHSASDRKTATPLSSSTRTVVAPTSAPEATPTVVPKADKGFRAFVSSLCGNLAGGNASGITGVLMYYQYNSGLRWGVMGDGEGHSDDPSVMSSWLAHARPRCISYSTGSAGHGAVLTSGWAHPGPWSIIEADFLNGAWKINDFTFGSQTQLARAMRVAGPRLTFHG